MIDLHSHILYGIDDGARDLQMTLDMLKMAEEDGITTMVATPHYIVGANQYDQEDLINRYHEVVAYMKKTAIAIDLLLGHELYIDQYLPESLEKDQCYGIGDTSYLLVELPMMGIPTYTDQVLYDLINRGYRPILAHPERYAPVQEDPNILMDYIKMGCLTQINSGSIKGLNGRKVAETAKLLLKNNMGHLVASDCHSNKRRNPRLSTAYNQVLAWIGKEKTDSLFFDNPQKVLEDDDIDREEPVPIQKRRDFLYVLRKYLVMTK